MESRSGHRRRSSRLLALGDQGGPDHISALPDDLLLLVLARLPCAGAAARTGVLSRRWHGLWTRLRRIVFSDVAFDSLESALGRFPPPPPAVSLLQIRLPKAGGRVRKEHRKTRLRSLLRAAARFDPEELVLVLPLRFVYLSLRLKLPCFHRATSIVLDLCSSVRFVPAGFEFPALERLSLSNCSADLDAFLSRCPRLRMLRLDKVHFHKGVLSVNSPLLQELVVACATWIQHVNIVAPMLTQLTMTLNVYQDGTISIVAPMVEKLCYLSRLHRVFGIWRVTKLSLQTAPERQEQLLSLYIRPIFYTVLNDEADDFRQEIEKNMLAAFSVLELHLTTKQHVYGALVFHLLGMDRIRCATRRLELILQRSKMSEGCSPHCPCDSPNWRSQNISLTALEEVEINGFEGDNVHDTDFLKLIFKCAPMLKRMTVKLSHEASSSIFGRTDIYDIFRAYPVVECYVYLSSGVIHGSRNCPST